MKMAKTCNCPQKMGRREQEHETCGFCGRFFELAAVSDDLAPKYLFTDVELAQKLAAGGMPQRAIAEETGLTKYEVEKAVEPEPTESKYQRKLRAERERYHNDPIYRAHRKARKNRTDLARAQRLAVELSERNA